MSCFKSRYPYGRSKEESTLCSVLDEKKAYYNLMELLGVNY